MGDTKNEKEVVCSEPSSTRKEQLLEDSQQAAVSPYEDELCENPDVCKKEEDGKLRPILALTASPFSSGPDLVTSLLLLKCFP